MAELDDVSNDLLAALRGTDTALHSGKFGSELLQEAEGISCRMYQTCCRDPKLDAIGGGASASVTGTCRTSHEGAATDMTVAFEDPSSPDFCRYVSGARLTIVPADGVCAILDAVMGDQFSLPQCQADFCAMGIDGYFGFVQSFVSSLQAYGYFIGAALGVVALSQIVVLANIWAVRRRYRRTGQASDPEQRSAKVSPYTAAGADAAANEDRKPPLRTRTASWRPARLRPPRL